jgi:LysM repeat protein
MKLKNLILPVLASFLVVAGVSAASYIIQPGDTLSGIAKLFGTTYQQLANNNGIANPNLIYAGDVIEVGGGVLGANPPMRPSGIDIAIRQSLASGASRSNTTLNIDPIITSDGHRWTMADIGDIAFAKIDPGTSNEEIISFSTITDNTTYYTLGGINWGYNYNDLTTSTSNYKRHNSGARFIITDDDHYLRYQYVNQYDGLMHDSYTPTTDQQVATVGYVQTYNGYYESPVATYADLPTGVNGGEMRITLDDGKVYTWQTSTATWILAGAGGGAGIVYRTDTVVTSTAQMTYKLDSGSWPAKNYLQVFRNGQLLVEGAGNDYTATTTGDTITLLAAPVIGEVITLRVESIDFYNAEWVNVNTDLTPDIDATHDVGTTSLRFRDLNISRNAVVGGTLNVVGETYINNRNINYISRSTSTYYATNTPFSGGTVSGTFNITHNLGYMPTWMKVYDSCYTRTSEVGASSYGSFYNSISNQNVNLNSTSTGDLSKQKNGKIVYCGRIDGSMFESTLLSYSSTTATFGFISTSTASSYFYNNLIIELGN